MAVKVTFPFFTFKDIQISRHLGPRMAQQVALAAHDFAITQFTMNEASHTKRMNRQKKKNHFTRK